MNAIEKLTALKRCQVMAVADDETIQWLAESVQAECCAPGDVIFEPGEVSQHVYVVGSGTLEVRLTENADLVSLLEPGALFGEYAMFAGGVRSAHVMVASEAVLLSVEDQHFQTFLLRCPEAMMHLLQTAVRRLHRAERQHR